MLEWRKRVKYFSKIMEEKIEEKIDKLPKRFDLPKTPEWYFSRAVMEMGELAEELISKNPDPFNLEREAADVANFVMQLAAKYKEMHTSK